MNIFGSKKEMWVMAGVAAFFVLVTLAFTFEPLVTVVLRTKTLPADTKEFLTRTSPKADFLDETMKTVPPSHAWAGNTALLNKIKDLVSGLNITSAAIQTNSVVLEAINEPEKLVTDIRYFLSRLTPFEIKTVLPDETFMIETVMDPDLINVVQNTGDNRLSWTFTQTSPQLTIQKNGLNSSIYVNYPQTVESHGFETPVACSASSNGIKTISLDPTRRALISALYYGFLAYIKHYPCFQSFSTLSF